MAKHKRILFIESDINFVVESVKERVTEGDDGGKKEPKFLELEGVFQKGNVPNLNRRIYKTELLAREVSKFQSVISSGRSLGKSYHPGFFDRGGPSGVTDVSHRITKLWMDGDLVKGKLILLNTQVGKDAKEIINGEGQLGISSRGYGSCTFHEKIVFKGKTYKNVDMMDDNFSLSTFDLVLTPSVKEALPTPTTNECRDTVLENNENENNGGKIKMTVEELKAQHPEIYNVVRNAAVKEGEEIGVKKGKDEAEKDLVGIKSKYDAELENIKESSAAKDGKISTLIKENEDLKADVQKAEAEKKAVQIKSAVSDAVNESEFKEYFTGADIDAMVGVCENVEAVKDEIAARIKIFESVISVYKVSNNPSSTHSVKKDTSEEGGSMDESEQDSKVFEDSQRDLAFG